MLDMVNVGSAALMSPPLDVSHVGHGQRRERRPPDPSSRRCARTRLVAGRPSPADVAASSHAPHPTSPLRTPPQQTPNSPDPQPNRHGSAPTSANHPAPSGPADTPRRVLEELRVENLLLIERAELRLAEGLNVLTGETGAGKTVLAHALDLLLGGRPRPAIVRPGAAEAYVEGVFALPEALPEQVPVDAEELVLARRVSAEGRT